MELGWNVCNHQGGTSPAVSQSLVFTQEFTLRPVSEQSRGQESKQLTKSVIGNILQVFEETLQNIVPKFIRLLLPGRFPLYLGLIDIVADKQNTLAQVK